MREQTPLRKSKQILGLSSTQTVYSDMITFKDYNDAHQMEAKVDVTAGDGTIVYYIETSDDSVTRFDVEDAKNTISGVDKNGIVTYAIGAYMRARIEYTHNSVDTDLTVFVLVR